MLGARAVLAVQGGFDVAPVYGSRATSLISHMGPFGGRALVQGMCCRWDCRRRRRRSSSGRPLALPDGGARLRVMTGPHAAIVRRAGLRDAVRLAVHRDAAVEPHGVPARGAALLAGYPVRSILSDATPIGSLQVPASGQPILLMADRQTTGGYPKIATVITADLPLAGQLAPGDWIEFAPVTGRDAHHALEERRSALEDRA